MLHAMTALHDNRDVLLSAMDVFVKEPLVDWVKLSRRLTRDQSIVSHGAKWFPREKIEIARRKLSCENSAGIMISELEGSVHADAQYLKHLRDIVRGDPKHNVRARLPQQCKSIKDQIDCLIDHATDPNILARVYAGWAPWI
eukprot:TRINITY_DN21794_c0_g1_i1.p2 TRINITY_DN21794_c0_g1~~TRINITY_DN21794_c0_g1_i1.p2  ORF type:complete len:142 (-),score=30.06 TRINITY_DN21794_c0_g1_i1:18-443(-)